MKLVLLVELRRPYNGDAGLGGKMTQNVDYTMVEVWKAVSALHARDDYAFLDQKSRSIIFAVADAEAQQKSINYKGIVTALRPKSHMPIYARLQQLIREGWLEAKPDPTDKRAKTLHLTPKTATFVNSLSSAIKRVVQATSAIAASLVAQMTYHDISSTLLVGHALTMQH